MSLCVWEHLHLGPCGGQKSALDPLECTWVLQTELGSSASTASILNCWACAHTPLHSAFDWHGNASLWDTGLCFCTFVHFVGIGTGYLAYPSSQTFIISVWWEHTKSAFLTIRNCVILFKLLWWFPKPKACDNAQWILLRCNNSY